MIINGDALEELKKLPSESVDMCVTSPPYYGLRDYGVAGQIGLEDTPPGYIERLTDVFREVKRVLKPQGTLWLNIGDSYWGSGSRGYDFTGKFTEASKVQTGSKGTIDLHNIPKLVGNVGEYKNKDLIGIPWMLAFALRADGWYLRQDIIWAKTNCMPESVTDRCTKSHEYIFLFSKQPQYYFDNGAIQEKCEEESEKRYKTPFFKGKQQEHFRKDGAVNTEGMKEFTGKRNKRDVWRVSCSSYKEAHFATFPEQLIEPCILAGSAKGGVVLDPIFGSGTTGVVATKHDRDFIGIELNPEDVKLAERRLSEVQIQVF